MGLVKSYLIAYNVFSVLAWLAILIEDAVDLLPGGYYHTGAYTDYPHKLLVITQTLNVVLELIHTFIGLVPTPVSALIPQFTARCVIAWGIAWYVPESVGNYSLFFAAFLVAWGVTEIFRYSFYAAKQLGHVPHWLVWIRYSTFIVMYPYGLVTEPWVLYQTLPHVSGVYYWLLAVGSILYIPGFIYLYGYMFKQRNRALNPKPKAE